MHKIVRQLQIRLWAALLAALLILVGCTSTPTPTPTPTPTIPPPTASATAPVAPTATPTLTIAIPIPTQRPQGVSTLVPILYEMHDWENTDFQHRFPTWGPLGAWMWWTWAQLQPAQEQYNWALVERYLEQSAQYTVTLRSGEVIPKPVALSIEIYPDWGQDGTPAWVYEQIADSPTLAGKRAGWVIDPDGADKPCQPISAPRWGDPAWEQRVDEMIMAFGKRYDQDPRVNSVWICTGLYGETIEEKTVGGCRYDLGQSGKMAAWVLHVMDTYRRAFPTKPLFIINSGGWRLRQDTAAKAASFQPPMGIKLNVLAPDLSDAYGYKSQTGGGKIEIVERYSETLPIAFEHAFSPRPAETYWSVMNGLAHRAVLMDFYYPEIFQTIAALDPIFPLWRFVDDHLGKNAQTTPDVWILLRETSQPPSRYAGWNSGEFGDWGFFLTRPEGIPENKTVAITETLKTELPAPAREHIYGAYSTRRTDQRSGNRYMSFDMDNRYPFWGRKPLDAGGDARYQVEVVLLNRGNDQVALQYMNTSGQLVTRAVQKGAALGPVDNWVTVVWNISDAYFHDEMPGGTDFRLDCMNDGDEVVHRLRVQGFAP